MNKINIIGYNKSGLEIINNLFPIGVTGANLIAINNDINSLDLIKVENKFCFDNLEELELYIQNSKLIFICHDYDNIFDDNSLSLISLAKKTGAKVIELINLPDNNSKFDKIKLEDYKAKLKSDSIILIDSNRFKYIFGNISKNDVDIFYIKLSSIMIKEFVELMTVPCLVGIDFADFNTILSEKGFATLGFASSDYAKNIEDIAEEALSFRLLNTDYEKAKGALIHIKGGKNITLENIDNIGHKILNSIDSTVNVIWGARIDDYLDKMVYVMVILTGVELEE